MTNEDHLVEANDLLREELDEARAEIDRMERRPLTMVRVAYACLLTLTVVGAAWSVFTTRAAWPVVFAVLTVGWIADRLRDEDDPDGKRWTARQWREWYSANRAPQPDVEDEEGDEDEDDDHAEASGVRVTVVDDEEPADQAPRGDVEKKRSR